MASKPQPEDLLAELDSLGAQAAARPSKSSTRAPRQGHPGQSSQSEQDLLAELGNLAQRPAQSLSRPGTPSLRPNATNVGNRSPKRSSTATSPPGRSSEEKSNNGGQRKSGDSTRSLNPTFTPATTTTEESPEPTPQAAPVKSGGWWGGILSTATAAVSQAQAAVREIQQNEEAQRYYEQVRGNVGALKGFGGELRSMAVPTFHNILQTIAPPISSHERLQIHITHDLTNYPTLDPIIYQVFSRVMSQVEGGDLMVVQKGQEASPRRESESTPRNLGSWHDGPWWRSGEHRSINAVKGIMEGSKLARASAEGYATERFAERGGVEEVAKKATETLSETNPTRDSEIFLAIQAINVPVPEGMFAAGASSEAEKGESQVSDPDADLPKDEVVFAIYLHDPVHGIAFQAISQAVLAQWIEWLDAPNGGEGTLPESIEEIISSGGVDPREWVSEWVEESLTLAIGVIAQRYVARRMGVGEGGARKGKGVLKAGAGSQSVIESGAGEAARAVAGM